MKEKFHIRLKRIRQRQGISMKDLANKAGIPQSTYREWEYGRAIQGEPYLDLAKALHISVSELLGEESSERNQKIKNSLTKAEQAFLELKLEVLSFF